jgi:hypothetical protein
MIGVLVIILSVLFAGALPWWPYSAAGRLQHHRPWDWLLDTPSLKDSYPITRETSILQRVASEAPQKPGTKKSYGNPETFEELQRQLQEHFAQINRAA